MYHTHHHRLPPFFSHTWLALSVGCLLLALLLAACGSGGTVTRDTRTGTTSASPSASTPAQTPT